MPFSIIPADVKDLSIEQIADLLLNHYVFVVGAQKFRLCEIEFYRCGPDHEDKYTHCNKLQKQFGELYFHQFGNGSYKSGTYKCMDITLGDGVTYYGVLIRSVQNIGTGEFTDGPCRSVNKLLEILGGYPDIKTFMADHAKDMYSLIKLEREALAPLQMFYGPRIGLSDKYPDYRDRMYRFATNIQNIKKKGFTKFTSAPAPPEVKAETVVVPVPALSEVKAETVSVPVPKITIAIKKKLAASSS